MSNEIKIVYGINPQTKWGMFAILDNETGQPKHQLMMICPNFANDHRFVVMIQELIFKRMEDLGLVISQEKVEEKKGS